MQEEAEAQDGMEEALDPRFLTAAVAVGGTVHRRGGGAGGKGGIGSEAVSKNRLQMILERQSDLH